MAARIRGHDRSATPLGPPERWSLPLRTLVGVVLRSNQPMFVSWGLEHALLYKDPCSSILAEKHPEAPRRVRMPSSSKSTRTCRMPSTSRTEKWTTSCPPGP